MSRSTDEWIGKNDNTPAPPRVRLRVFEKYGGRCYLSGRKIGPGDKWQLDHVVALINGGQNRESNLAPALTAPHAAKTRLDVAIKSKVARTRAKHLGIHPKPARSIPARPDPWGKNRRQEKQP